MTVLERGRVTLGIGTYVSPLLLRLFHETVVFFMASG